MSKYVFNTTAKRSNLMRKIKSNNTTPELLLRKSLWTQGVRFRLNEKNLPATPAIVITKKMRFLLTVNFGMVIYGMRKNRKYKQAEIIG